MQVEQQDNQGGGNPPTKINNNHNLKPSARAVKSGRKKMKNFKDALNAIIERKGTYILDFQEYKDGHITANFDAFANIISVSV